MKQIQLNKENFGLKKIELSKAEFISVFECVLEKCGQFVTHINLEEYDEDGFNEEFVNIITKKCPNLQDIDVGYQNFYDERKIDVLMPIVDKLKRLDCNFDDGDDTNDEDLGNLLLLNEKLEFFSISSNEVLNGTFLDAIRGDSIKELIISHGGNISFHLICRVSTRFNYFTYTLSRKENISKLVMMIIMIKL